MTDPIERAAMALLPHGWAHATEALRGVKRNEARAAILPSLIARVALLRAVQATKQETT